jgi:hypothetical protein
MQILTISKKDSRPEVAITAFLTSAGLTKTSISPTQLPLFDLDDADCAIYIDPRPDFKIIDRLQEHNCPAILVADQNFDGSQCQFIPFGILDRSNSVSIGIKKIRDYLDTLPINPNGTIFSTSTSSDHIDQLPNPNNNQRAPTIHQFRQANDEFNSFESLATG